VIQHRGPSQQTLEDGNLIHKQTEEDDINNKKKLFEQNLQFKPENYKILSFAKEMPHIPSEEEEEKKEEDFEKIKEP